MVRVVRNREELRSTNYSSFILPIGIALVIVIFVIRLFFWWSSEILNKSWNYVNITPNQEKSEINIYMSWDSKKQIEWVTKLFSTDNKVEVVSGEALITVENDNSKLFLDRLWEIKYNWLVWDKQSFDLLNSQLWAEVQSPNFEFNLKNFTVNSDQDSVIAFSQNMMASNIYVLKGEVKIKLNTKNPISWSVWVWQKMTILNSDLKNESLKLTDKIEPIDDMFRTEDWFIKHNWWNYISNSSGSGETTTGSWGTWSINILKNQKLIIFTYPEDEASIEGDSVDFEGKIVSDNVSKITLDDKEVSIDRQEKTFAFKGFTLRDAISNIVYKVYDKNNDLLLKWVMSLYASTVKTKKPETEKPTVTTYPLSSKDFSIVSPVDNPFKTTEDIVKIAWQVNKWAVKYITINGFRLTKYPQYSAYWYYFANKDYGTMNDGINLYNIKYYWKEDNLLFESLFTIVKEPKEVKTEEIKTNSETWSTSWTGSFTNG